MAITQEGVQNFIKISPVDSPYMPGHTSDKHWIKPDTTAFPRPKWSVPAV